MEKSALENLFFHELKVLTIAEKEISQKLRRTVGKIPAGPAQELLDEQAKASENRTGQLSKILASLERA